MKKYLVRWEDTGFEVVPDNPDYDGPITSIYDNEYVYHIEAVNSTEAIKIAEVEKKIDEAER